MPARLPNDSETGLTSRETEPLLGRPGAVAQEEDKSALNNLVLGMTSPPETIHPSPSQIGQFPVPLP